MKTNSLFEKLDKTLSPIGAKIGNQIHLKAVSTGMMLTLPMIVIGSLFLIVANPPINPDLIDPNTTNIFLKFLLSWKDFAVKNYSLITTPYDMTMGMLGLITAFTIAFSLASEYKMKSAMSGLISMAVFLMICAPMSDGNIPTKFLGTNGLFLAILIGIISVEITRLIEKKGFEVKLPSSVPPAVTAFINSMFPLLANIIILYGLNIIVKIIFGVSIPQGILQLLNPALSVVDNIWGFLLIVTFGNILWLIGVNGTSIIFPIVFTLGITNTGLNAELIAAGKEPNIYMNLQMFRATVLGGAGNTLGLCILMLKSKSVHLKSLGRLSTIPGICGINEPIIFGSPIVFNPILAIPFIITPIVTVSMTYFAQVFGIIGTGHIVDPSFTPFFIQAYLSSLDFRNVIFSFVIVIVSIFIYYPFFKVYEKNILKQESAQN
ncbi:MAG TPA: PTS transporter subunit EIIC [Candidatus Dwaynia gallinarum]|nr:PTS transporter subunit EIIC [Candidatus Dwaynia gallinarum]